MNKETADNHEEIIIKPQSKNHSRFLIVVGTCLLLISLLLNSIFWDQYKFQLMLIMFACVIILLIGLLKYSEPDTSYKLTRQQLSFYHRNGNWSLPWFDIQRLGTMNGYVKGELTQLPYVGIKLKNIECILDTISPRLANKLIHEQKELLILAARNHEITLNDGLISFEPYKLNDKVYKGPIAAWLFRTDQLNQVYGYHLYLSETSFDRSVDEFSRFLNQCKDYSDNQH